MNKTEEIKTKEEAGFYEYSKKWGSGHSNFCRGCPAGETGGSGCIRDKSRTCWLSRR